MSSPARQVPTRPPLDQADTVPQLLRTATVELTEALDAAGCLISRLVGELLVDVAEHSVHGRSLHLGYGYLLSDYPVTDEVMRLRRPRWVSLVDADPDPQEAKILRELEFDSVLMLPLACGPELWGLVEVYRAEDTFAAPDAEVAERIVERAGEVLERLELARRQT